MQLEGRARVVIEGVAPEIDGGRFPIKRAIGEKVVVEADAYTDGHDLITCVLRWRPTSETTWHDVTMESIGNDRWRGSFQVQQIGRYQYTFLGWVDPFKTWRYDLKKRVAAHQNVDVELLIGANLIERASQHAPAAEGKMLSAWAERLRQDVPQEERVVVALDEGLFHLMSRFPERRFASTYEKELEVVVDRERARFSTWYELFPRSCSPEPGKHGTLKDVEHRLPMLAAMGFDVLYLPPIHPVGRTFRKGKNNNPTSQPGDVGSPWGIGAAEGGHKSVHPDLGTIEDLRNLVAKTQEHGLELALDIAFQCSPDHPYVQSNPEWFRHRPDGTIQYAENPPKKYQDIYPLDFETENWQGLWEELRDVMLFWVGQGVKIFRVDNPHTKAFAFWEYAINSIKKDHPEVIFLSEAFTRPKVMYRLAKLGFTQSYTYFAWRNTSWELREYFTELTQTQAVEFFRPNLWPNTPDILTEYLQVGGRPAFMIRLVLAATLGASYGIYGPAFELCEHVPVAHGKEEYLNSEKYEIKRWDLERPDSLREFIARVNRIRQKNPALQGDRSLRFHEVDNPQLICYSKQSDDKGNLLVMVVNLDPYHTQSGHIILPLHDFELDHSQPYQVHDLLGDGYYLWHGARNYVELNPHFLPAHIFRIRHRVRTEQDFEYYM